MDATSGGNSKKPGSNWRFWPRVTSKPKGSSKRCLTPSGWLSAISSMSRHEAAATLFLGRAARNPADYPRTIDGFDSFLIDNQVRYFPASEICNVRADRREYLSDDDDLPLDNDGNKILLAPIEYWHRKLALISLMDRIRAFTVEPIVVRYLWRPENFNANIGSTDKSDHVSASGIDVSFASNRALSMAVRHFLQPMWQLNMFDLSLGWNSGGTLKMHVGLHAPRTEEVDHQRMWDYVRDSDANLFDMYGS